MQATEQEQVLIRGKCFLYKQKAPFVPSGVSVFGALEYREKDDAVRCHECGKWFRYLGIHLQRAHSLYSSDYKNKHGLRRSASLCGLRATVEGTHRASLRWKNTERGKLFKKPEVVAKRLETIRIERSKAVGRPRYEMRNVNGTCRAQLEKRITSLIQEVGGRTPTQDEFSAARIHLRSTFLLFNVTDSRSLVSLFGLAPNPTGGSGHLVRRGYSRAQLIEIIRDFYGKWGRLPVEGDARPGLIPCGETFRKEFGSLHGAYCASGLGLVEHRWQRSREELIKALQDFFSTHGRLPRKGENGMPANKAFLVAFGSRASAYKAAGLSHAMTPAQIRASNSASHRIAEKNQPSEVAV